jgi:hypothetical protein
MAWKNRCGHEEQGGDDTNGRPIAFSPLGGEKGKPRSTDVVCCL